jgi:hypothetical protein
LNTENYTNLLAHPQKISRDELTLLSFVIEKYPYFQSARALQLKALKNDSSFLYNDALKLTAAYTTDRDILFEYITSKSFVQNEISKVILSHDPAFNDIEVVAENVSESVSIEIDKQLKEEIKRAEAILNPNLFERKIDAVSEILANSDKVLQSTEDNEDIISEVEKTKDTFAEDTLELHKPLEFTERDTHSFNEWLQLTKTKPIERNTISKKEAKANDEDLEEAEIPNERERKNELIEKFIQNKPKLAPITVSAKQQEDKSQRENLATLYTQAPEALMTETLAKVYLSQKNYLKAIKAYKILILKYPEKSGFFADKIRAIEKLINTEEQ